MNKKLLDLYDAITIDDHLTVRQILNNDLRASTKIPTKYICGLIVLAAENNSVKSSKEFVRYNDIVNNESIGKHINFANKIFSNDNQPTYKVINSEMLH